MGKQLKNKEIWAMSPKDRDSKVEELRNELMHERAVGAMGGALRSPGKVRALRTSIARVLTIQNQARRIDAAKAEKKAREERAAVEKTKAEERARAKEQAPKETSKAAPRRAAGAPGEPRRAAKPAAKTTPAKKGAE